MSFKGQPTFLALIAPLPAFFFLVFFFPVETEEELEGAALQPGLGAHQHPEQCRLDGEAHGGRHKVGR